MAGLQNRRERENRRDVESGGIRGKPRKTEELGDGPSPPTWREADGMALPWVIQQSTMQWRPRRKEGFAWWDGDVRRGRVDETKPAADEFSEADAVAKGGNDRGLGKGLGNVGDPEIGTKEPDEAPSARGIHIASGDGNNNINGDDDEEFRQQGLVCELTTYSYRIAQWQR